MHFLLKKNEYEKVSINQKYPSAYSDGTGTARGDQNRCSRQNQVTGNYNIVRNCYNIEILMRNKY